MKTPINKKEYWTMTKDLCGACSYECDETKLSCLPIAMAYVPMQKFQELYNPETAFCAGTLFKELDKPFLGSGVGG